MTKASAAVLLMVAGVVPGAPSMRFGAQLTATDGHIFTSCEDSSGEFLRLTHEDPYVGLGLEAVYGPLWWLYGRFQLTELRFFRNGGGELAIAPPVGLDLLLEPQLGWRLAPYLWAGATWSGCWGSQGTPDPRFDGYPVYWTRAGLGLGYKLNRSLHLFGELQLYDGLLVKYAIADPLLPWLPVEFEGIGFARANLGVRYDFWAK